MMIAKEWPERRWSSLPSNTFWGSSECKLHNATLLVLTLVVYRTWTGQEPKHVAMSFGKVWGNKTSTLAAQHILFTSLAFFSTTIFELCSFGSELFQWNWLAWRSLSSPNGSKSSSPSSHQPLLTTPYESALTRWNLCNLLQSPSCRPLLGLLALQQTCFLSDSTPAYTPCRCWAALRSPLQSRRDPCPFISAFSSNFLAVNRWSSSTTRSVSWTSAPDRELNQNPQVCKY